MYKFNRICVIDMISRRLRTKYKLYLCYIKEKLKIVFIEQLKKYLLNKLLLSLRPICDNNTRNNSSFCSASLTSSHLKLTKLLKRKYKDIGPLRITDLQTLGGYL